MKKGSIYIYIMALLASLLVSCSSTLDEEIIQQQDEIGISFTLSIKSVNATRSLSSELIDTYETRLSSDDFRVLAYDASGIAYEVDFTMNEDEVSKGVYHILGELKSGARIYKIVILANCNQHANSEFPDLSTLSYLYKPESFNPGNPKAYIPMWGEAKIPGGLNSGSNNLGTIHLMRAMAKVSVKSTTETIDYISLIKYNESGTCVPNSGYITGSGESLGVNAPTLPNKVSRNLGRIPFYRVSDKEMIIYIPEQMAEEETSTIEVKMGEKLFPIYFRTYNINGKPRIPVLRNTHYIFNITSRKNDFNVKVLHEVVDWDSKSVEIGFN